MSASLGELAVRFGCELRGDPDVRITHVATLAHAGPGGLAFLANPRYRPQLAGTGASAVVLEAGEAANCPCAALIASNPYATYARIAVVLHPRPQRSPGVHPSAVVDPSARIDPQAHVGELAVVGPRVQVGARAQVGPHCVLEEDVRIEADVVLTGRVTLCRGVQVGARSVLQPGVVVGGDGFGFAPERGGWLKVPQVGSVRIGADVEVGANTTIDRGAIEDTVIADGVKLDNLIQVGHNVRIGEHTAIAGCVGISGSTQIGRRCQIGGAVGIGGHLSIADDVIITGYSMVSRSISRAGVYSSGIPFEEARVWRRMVAHFKRIERLGSRVARLERAAGLAGETPAPSTEREQDGSDD